MGVLDDLGKFLKDKLGADEAKVKEFLDKLRDAAGGDEKKAEDLARELGRILGAFGGGVMAGGAGLDPATIARLLELFGPLAEDLLGKLLKKLFGDGSGYRPPTCPGPTPHKRERMKVPDDVFDLTDDHAPDVYVRSRYSISCAGDFIRITFSLGFTVREEPIERIQVIPYGQLGPGAPVQIGSGTTINGGDGASDRVRKAPDARPHQQADPPLPEPDDQEEGQRYYLEVSVDMPCRMIMDAGGVVVIELFVTDVDGNQMYDFVAVDLRGMLLGDERCCRNVPEDEVRRRLVEATGRITGQDIRELLDLMGLTPEKPAPPTAPTSGTGTGTGTGPAAGTGEKPGAGATPGSGAGSQPPAPGASPPPTGPGGTVPSPGPATPGGFLPKGGKLFVVAEYDEARSADAIAALAAALPRT